MADDAKTRSSGQSENAAIVAIVDDDRALLESLGDFFDAMGIGSVAFNSGDAFLKSGELRRVRCVLVDLKMPGMNGIELLRKIVADQGPPVCIMTSFADSGTRKMAQSCGAVAFLEKPVNSRELLAFVSTSGFT